MLSYLFGRHQAWSKDGLVERIRFVQPPFFIQKTAFLLQPRVQPGAGHGHQMIERRHVEAIFLREPEGLGKGVRGVVVVSEDKSPVNPYPVAVKEIGRAHV